MIMRTVYLDKYIFVFLYNLNTDCIILYQITDCCILRILQMVEYIVCQNMIKMLSRQVSDPDPPDPTTVSSLPDFRCFQIQAG